MCACGRKRWGIMLIFRSSATDSWQGQRQILEPSKGYSRSGAGMYERQESGVGEEVRKQNQNPHPSPVLTCRRHSLWPLCGGFCGSLCNRAGAEEPRERTQSPHRIPFPRGFGDIESSGTLWATLRSGDTGTPRLG